MFIRFYTFNVWVILAGIIGLVGAALVLARLSLARFHAYADAASAKPRSWIRSQKTVLLMGAGLTALAVLIMPIGRGVDWIGDRFVFRDNAVYDASRFAAVPGPAEGPLDLKGLPASRKYAFRRGELVMTRTGYIETPVWRWPAGRYAVEVELKGKDVQRETSEVMAAFLAFSGRRFASEAPVGRHYAGPESHVWRYEFRVAAATPGKVRLQLMNASTETAGIFREIRITRAEIRRLGS